MARHEGRSSTAEGELHEEWIEYLLPYDSWFVLLLLLALRRVWRFLESKRTDNCSSFYPRRISVEGAARSVLTPRALSQPPSGANPCRILYRDRVPSNPVTVVTHRSPLLKAKLCAVDKHMIDKRSKK